VESHSAAMLMSSLVGGTKVRAVHGTASVAAVHLAHVAVQREAFVRKCKAAAGRAACPASALSICGFQAAAPRSVPDAPATPRHHLVGSLAHPPPCLPACLQLLGVLLSLFLVDTLGRRPLLLWGSLGCAASLAALALADWLALKAFLVAAMCAFIFAFRWVAGLPPAKRVCARLGACVIEGATLAAASELHKPAGRSAGRLQLATPAALASVAPCSHTHTHTHTHTHAPHTLHHSTAVPPPCAAHPSPWCSASWAGVFWVLLSELFSMSAKSPAASAATATLFLTGGLTGGGG
jgi:hypothetical protein